jgi:hypothetical protein
MALLCKPVLVPQIDVVVTPDGVVATKESVHAPVVSTPVTKFAKSSLKKTWQIHQPSFDALSNFNSFGVDVDNCSSTNILNNPLLLNNTKNVHKPFEVTSILIFNESPTQGCVLI